MRLVAQELLDSLRFPRFDRAAHNEATVDRQSHRIMGPPTTAVARKPLHRWNE